MSLPSRKRTTDAMWQVLVLTIFLERDSFQHHVGSFKQQQEEKHSTWIAKRVTRKHRGLPRQEANSKKQRRKPHRWFPKRMAERKVWVSLKFAFHPSSVSQIWIDDVHWTEHVGGRTEVGGWCAWDLLVFSSWICGRSIRSGKRMDHSLWSLARFLKSHVKRLPQIDYRRALHSSTAFGLRSGGTHSSDVW